MTAIHAAHHHLQRMTGRDPREHGRVATTLELLYDLTIVVAFGVAGSEFAHALAAATCWPAPPRSSSCCSPCVGRG